MWRLLKHFWYVPVILVALLIGGWLIMDLFSDKGKKLTVAKTPVRLERIAALNQWVSSNFIGETLSSLSEAYSDLDESELMAHYAFIRNAALDGQELNKDTYYSLLKTISGIGSSRSFEEAVKKMDWSQFQKSYADEINKAIGEYASNHVGHADLVYLARGKVQAGFDLSKLRYDRSGGSSDTIVLKGLDPQIISTEINPLFVPEKGIPGFQLILARDEKAISFDQITVVKNNCIVKLKKDAIEKGIFEKAIVAAEREMSILVTRSTDKRRFVKIEPNPHYKEIALYLADGVMDRAETMELASKIAGDTTSSEGQDSTEISKPGVMQASLVSDWWSSIFGKDTETVTKDISTSFRDLAFLLDSLTCKRRNHSSWYELIHDLKNNQPVTPGNSGSSPHRSQIDKHKALGLKSEADWDKYWGHDGNAKPALSNTKKLKNEYKTFGWHPYYMGSSYKSYPFDLLWGVSYWGAEVEPTSGTLKDTHDWSTTGLVTDAKAAGTKVFLTFSNFGITANKEFFGSEDAQNKLIDQIISALDERDADGANIDFEEVPSSVKSEFNDWLVQLSSRLKEKGYLFTLCLYAVDFSQVFDIPKLKNEVDLFIIMGYDYYYAGSKTAGPVSPLLSAEWMLPYNLESSVDYYLKQGVPRRNLLVAVPYYGREWKTAGKGIPAVNDGFVDAPIYTDIVTKIVKGKPELQPISETQLYQFEDSKANHVQLWYDDATTLSAKYKWFKDKGIGGIGIWALGYDYGQPELWNLIESEFGKN